MQQIRNAEVEQSSTSLLAANAHLQVARLASIAGQPKEARAAVTESLRVARAAWKASGDDQDRADEAKRYVVLALSHLGDLQWEQGQFTAAERTYAESLGYSREEVRDHPKSASALENLGSELIRYGEILQGLGRLAEAGLLPQRVW